MQKYGWGDELIFASDCDEFVDVPLGEEDDAEKGNSDAIAPTSLTQSSRHDRFGFPLTEEALRELEHYHSRKGTHILQHPFRVHRWEQLLGSLELYRSNINYHKELLLSSANSQEREIRVDVSRTFPRNSLFESCKGSQRLESILRAYAVRNPAVGYCQGMNYVAGFLLLAMEEECASTFPGTPAAEIDGRVFWMVVCIVEHPRFHRGYYMLHTRMFALKEDCVVFRNLVSSHIPEIEAHLQRYPRSPILTVLCANWFITLFVDSLPSEALVRVWDSYALEGRVALFRAGIALLHVCKQDVLSAADIHIVNAVRKRSRSMHVCEDFLLVFYSDDLVRSVTPAVVDAMKRDLEEKVIRSFSRSMMGWSQLVCLPFHLCESRSDAPPPSPQAGQKKCVIS
jgi:hypothetical protein